MNTDNFEDLSWALQQDYILFLSVLGWLLACLVAWGNATSGEDAPGLPWRMLALFCMTRAIDGVAGVVLLFGLVEGGTGGLAPWVSEAKLLSLILGYTALFEFARRAYNLAHVRKVPAGIALIYGLGFGFTTLMVGFNHGFVFAAFGSVAGFWAGLSLFRVRNSSPRVLGWTAIVLVLLGPAELMSEAGLRFFFGLPQSQISFLGLPSAVLGNLLAWIMALGLWMGVVLARRYVSRPMTGYALTSVALWLFPMALIVILLGGYYLLNWNAQRVQLAVQKNYIYRVQTAALSINQDDVATLAYAESDRDTRAYLRLQRQLAAIREVSESVRFVYLWAVRGGSLIYPVDSGFGRGRPEGRGTLVRRRASVNDEEAFLRDYPYFLGPFRDGIGALVVANARISDLETGATLCWLGMDIDAEHWFASYANARVQTIAIVGLFAALVVFFLAYQMLRESEGDLVVAMETAEAADRAKSEFLAVMSHEIRTPLQSVLGYGELLARSKLTPTETGYLDAIRSQGKTLLRIVQDILDFSALRKTSYTLKNEPVYLHKVVELAFNTARPMADRKGLDYQLKIDPAVPAMVEGDGVRLQQILLNLLGNAVKFTPSGSVTLEVTQDSIDRTLKPPVAVVIMRIVDTGIGIRPEDKRRMFEPFTQLGLSQHVPREGAGLGLAIVKRLCDLMGGSISLESEPGAGSRFRIELPFKVLWEELESTDAEGRLQPPVQEEPIMNLAAMVPLKILVAEDNPFIRNLLLEYLKQLGYSAKAVATGLEAVRNWKGFDLLILDLRMPEMDGVEAAGHIREASGESETPWIIGVSATLQEAEINRAAEAGMNDFLGKPFYVQSLQEAIRASYVFGHPPGEGSGGALVDDLPGPEEGGTAFVAESGTEDSPGEKEADTGDIYRAGILDDELIQEAIGEIPTLLSDMKSGLNDGDFDHVQDRAHYLKNTIYALKMDELFEACEAVYEMAGLKRSADAWEALGALGKAFERWQDNHRKG